MKFLKISFTFSRTFLELTVIWAPRATFLRWPKKESHHSKSPFSAPRAIGLPGRCRQPHGRTMPRLQWCYRNVREKAKEISWKIRSILSNPRLGTLRTNLGFRVILPSKKWVPLINLWGRSAARINLWGKEPRRYWDKAVALNSNRTYTPHAGIALGRPYVSKANSLKLYF